MEGSVVLISVHPDYAEKILSGEKRLEFRRRWAIRQVKRLVIYVTSPVQQIVAIAHVEEVHRGCKSRLWELAKNKGGGISRRKLFEYMEGKQEGVALELSRLVRFDAGGLSPSQVFGNNFRPPQSFRYLNLTEFGKLKNRLGGR
jgi:predicted transcriptional regulator